MLIVHMYKIPETVQSMSDIPYCVIFILNMMYVTKQVGMEHDVTLPKCVDGYKKD